MYSLRWLRRGQEYSHAMYRHKSAEGVMTWLEDAASDSRLVWIDMRGPDGEILLVYDEKENTEAGL